MVTLTGSMLRRAYLIKISTVIVIVSHVVVDNNTTNNTGDCKYHVCIMVD
jgi:hypothetical protein